MEISKEKGVNENQKLMQFSSNSSTNQPQESLKGEFKFENPDRSLSIKDKFLGLAFKLDPENKGELDLSSIPNLLKPLPFNYRGPLSTFFTAFIKQTGRYTMSINLFVTNGVKATTMKKFGLHLLKFDIIKNFQLPTNDELKPKYPISGTKRYEFSTKRFLNSSSNRKVQNIKSSLLPPSLKNAEKAKPSKNQEKESNEKSRKKLVNNLDEDHQNKMTTSDCFKSLRPITQGDNPKLNLNNSNSNFMNSFLTFDFESPFMNTSFRKPVAKNETEEQIGEQILVDNKFSQIGKQLSGSIDRSLTSEERQFMKCTFKPDLYYKKAYSSVKPRLLQHFDPKDKIPTLKINLQSNSNLVFGNSEFNKGITREKALHTSVLGKKDKDIFEGNSSLALNFPNYSRINSGKEFSSFDALDNGLSSLKFNLEKNQNLSNFFVTNTNKELGYLVRSGYSYKHREKKHFFLKKSIDDDRIHNKILVRQKFNDKTIKDHLRVLSEAPSIDRNNLSKSSNEPSEFYNLLFSDRKRSLSKSIMDSIYYSEGKSLIFSSREKDNTKLDLSNIKKNLLYKDLSISLNCKEIFAGKDHNELTNIRKLHVLYAAKKEKEVKSSNSSNKNEEKKL